MPTLAKAAEDHKNELIVILAGYKKEMELFMLSNPGLQSRFPIQITFSDYSLDELMEIAEQMAREREYSLSTSAKGYLRSYLGEVSTLNLNFSNARLVRNLIEKALRKQAVRLVDSHEPSRNQLMTLEKVDVRKGYHEDPGEKFIITEPAGNAFLEDGDMIE